MEPTHSLVQCFQTIKPYSIRLPPTSGAHPNNDYNNHPPPHSPTAIEHHTHRYPPPFTPQVGHTLIMITTTTHLLTHPQLLSTIHTGIPLPSHHKWGTAGVHSHCILPHIQKVTSASQVAHSISTRKLSSES